MDAATTSLELHELRGIHAVSTHGPGPRAGGIPVTGARRDALIPEAPETANHQRKGITLHIMSFQQILYIFLAVLFVAYASGWVAHIMDRRPHN